MKTAATPSPSPEPSKIANTPCNPPTTHGTSHENTSSAPQLPEFGQPTGCHSRPTVWGFPVLEYYLALLKIQNRFANSPFAQATKQATSAHTSASWVAKEQEAQRSYEALMRKASLANDERDMARMTKALQAFGADNQDTVFGRLAANATDGSDS
jgi:hypothetical protein